MLNTIQQIIDYEKQSDNQRVPYRSTFEIIQRAAKTHASRPAISFLPNGCLDDTPQTLTYAQFFRRVTQAANLFHGLGITATDTIALLLPTFPETFEVLFGAECAGRVCPINYMLAAPQIADILRASNAKILVILGPDPLLPIWEKLADIERLVAHPLQVLRIDPGQTPYDTQPDTLTFARTIAPDEIAAHYHTGGSTGRPKLVIHTHANQIHASVMMAEFFDLSAADAIFNGFPLFHVAGGFCWGLAAFAAGTHVVIPSRLGMRNRDFIAQYWRLVERHRVTILNGGPTFITMLLNQPLDADISHVRGFVSGGSPLPADLAKTFEKTLDIPVRNVLGMTETCGLLAAAPFGAPYAPGSAGLRLPHADIAALAWPDGDTTPLPPNQTGQIAIRGRQVTPGYNDPALTADAFTSDGWLLTGDLGHIDPEGRVFITGRAKDVIIRGGHNIDPAGIEEVLSRHPAVRLCAAVGQPDPHAGELPVAYVQLHDGARTTPDQILADTAPLMPEPAAVPKRLYLLEAFPLTATGKILRPALRRDAAARILREALEALGIAASLTCEEDPLGRTIVRATVSPHQADATRACIARYRLDPIIV